MEHSPRVFSSARPDPPPLLYARCDVLLPGLQTPPKATPPPVVFHSSSPPNVVKWAFVVRRKSCGVSGGFLFGRVASDVAADFSQMVLGQRNKPPHTSCAALCPTSTVDSNNALAGSWALWVYRRTRILLFFIFHNNVFFIIVPNLEESKLFYFVSIDSK